MNGSLTSARWLLPKFLRDDYSPYQCRISANREDYGARARMIHLKNLLKTWVNTGSNPLLRPVECRACLFDTRIPNIYIGADGLCNMCMTYRKNFRRELLEDEVRAFVRTPREPGAPVDAVVAFSGGKDSATALWTALEKLNLTVVAVLVDNGFIPEEVVRNGRRLCEKLGVELVVLRIDFKPTLRSLMDSGFRSGYPCYRCGELFHQAIQKYCAENRINRVILGRNWWRWLEPEVRSVRRVWDESAKLSMQFLSLPFALQLKESDVRAVLDKLDWSPAAIEGNSTNCLIPGLVAYPIYRRIGYHPELNLLSREVITGFLAKEEARAKLLELRDRTSELERLAEHKLSA